MQTKLTGSESGGDNIAAFKAMRAFRALRPLRVISRFEGLSLILDCLTKAIPALTNVIIVAFLFIFLFSILGINFFSGKLFKCVLP